MRPRRPPPRSLADFETQDVSSRVGDSDTKPFTNGSALGPHLMKPGAPNISIISEAPPIDDESFRLLRTARRQRAIIADGAFDDVVLFVAQRRRGGAVVRIGRSKSGERPKYSTTEKQPAEDPAGSPLEPPRQQYLHERRQAHKHRTDKDENEAEGGEPPRQIPIFGCVENRLVAHGQRSSAGDSRIG